MSRKVLGLTLLCILLTASVAGATIYGTAYVGSSAIATLYSISPTTGVATAIGSTGFSRMSSLAFGPTGTLYGVGITGGTDFLVTINTVTGAATAIGSGTGVGDHFQDIAFRPSDGKLFGYAEGSIYTFNLGTGAATLVGDTGKGFPDGNGLAFSAAGVLYSANDEELVSINQSTGAATTVVALNYSAAFGTGQKRAAGMKFDPSTGTLYASVIVGDAQPAEGAALGIINIATGNVTPVGGTTRGMDAIAITGSFPGVPAPSSVRLAFAGLLMLFLWTWWRSRRAATAE